MDTSTQQVESSPPALCEKTSSQSLNLFGVRCSSSLAGCQPSTENMLPDEEMLSCTDEQIYEQIERKVAHYKNVLFQNNGKCGHRLLSNQLDYCTDFMDVAFQFGFILSKSSGAVPLPTTCPPVRDGAAKPSPSCAFIDKSIAVEQESECRSEKMANTNLIPQTKVAGDYVSFELKLHSAGIQVSAEHTSDSVDGASVDLVSSVLLNGNGMFDSSGVCRCKTIGNNRVPCKWCNKNVNDGQATYNPLTSLGKLVAHLKSRETIATMAKCTKVKMHQCWNRRGNKRLFTSTEHPRIKQKTASTFTNSELTSESQKEIVSLHKMEQMPTSSCTTNLMMEREKRDTERKPTSAVGLDRERCSVSEDLQTKSRSVTSENGEHKPTSLTQIQETKVQNLECHQNVARVKRHSLSNIQIHNVVSLAEQPAPPESGACSLKTVNVPLNEDLSNVEKLTPQCLHTQGGLRSSTPYALQYDNVEDQERDSNYQLPLESESSKRVLTEIISDEVPEMTRVDTRHWCADPRYAETGGIACISGPKCDPIGHLKWQSNNLEEELQEPILKDDDQLHDDWMIFPISISNLEREDENQNGSSPCVLLGDGETPVKKMQQDPSPTNSEDHHAVSFFSPIVEFDTKESFKEAMRVQHVHMLGVAPGCKFEEPDSEREVHIPQKKSGPLSQAEDRCDTDNRCNYPSGSKLNCMTGSRKPSASTAADGVDPQEAKVDATNVQSREKINVTISTKKFAEKMKQLMDTMHAKISVPEVILIDSDTEDEDDQNYKTKPERKRFLSGTDRGNALCGEEKNLSPEKVEQLYGEVKFNKSGPSETQNQSKLCDKNICPDLSHKTESSGLLIVTQSGSECDHYNGQKKSKEQIIIISDTEDEVVQNDTKKRTFSPALVEGCIKTEVQGVTSSPTPEKPHQQYPKLRELLHRPCSDQPKNTEELTQLEDGADDEDHINRPRLSSGRSAKRIPSETEDDNDDLDATSQRQSTESPCEAGNKIRKTKRLSLKKAKWKKQVPSATSEMPPCLETSPPIQRLLVQTSPTSAACLRLVEESTVQVEGNDEPQASKITDRTASTGNSSTSELPHFGEASTSCGLLASKQNTSTGISTKGPSSSANIQVTAAEELRKKWKDSYIPTRKDRKIDVNKGPSTSMPNDSRKEARAEPLRPGKAHKKRPNPYKIESPWVKKSRVDAIMCTKARHCDVTRKPSYTVGDHYKWSEKPAVAKATKRVLQVQKDVETTPRPK